MVINGEREEMNQFFQLIQSFKDKIL